MKPKLSFPFLILCGIACAIFCSCDLGQDSGADKQYLSLRVDSALTQYEKVTITLMGTDGDTLETVWDGPLPKTANLSKLEVKKYQGGPVTILIIAEDNGKIVYARVVHYTGRDAKPKIDSPSLPDYGAPEIHLLQSETLSVLQGDGFRDSANCVDERDSHPKLTISGKVNADSVGIYTLTYACGDSSGNAAAPKHRIVNVRPRRDNFAPALSLIGPDSMSVILGDVFLEPGAVCIDDRDTHPQTVVNGKVRTDSVGIYALGYTCTDSSGNTAPPKIRLVTVHVFLAPDTTAPVLSLAGGDSLTIVSGGNYVDSGATCRDDRDGTWNVTGSGSINTGVIGTQTLTYRCQDKAGNQASRSRVVHVVDGGTDVTPPVLKLDGPAFVTITRGQPFVEPAYSCVDAVSGTRFVEKHGEVDTTKVGVYSRLYSCSDQAGNVSEGHRQFVVQDPSTVLPAIKEASFDTNYGFNLTNGLDPTFGICGLGSDDWLTLIQFDMTQVTKTGLVSAKAVYNLFGLGDGKWNGDSAVVTFRINRLTHPWSEGNGNWFYHDGAWANGGEVYFSNYVIRPEVLSASMDPASAEGVNSKEKAYYRPENLIPVGAPQKKVLRFTAAQTGYPGTIPIPLPKNLVQLEIDMTEYVKSSPGATDYGFLMTIEGLGGKGIRGIGKELGDGSLGPKLILKY